MSKTANTKPLENRIIKTELVEWRKFKFFQPDGFKDLSNTAFEKLKASIFANDFIETFIVWENKELYCLDGYHRCKVLEQLSAAGIRVPERLPGTFIRCKSKKDAARLVLIYSSIYARVTDEGLYEFLESNRIQFDDIKLEIDIPSINLAEFEKGYVLPDPDVVQPEEPCLCPNCGARHTRKKDGTA